MIVLVVEFTVRAGTEDQCRELVRLMEENTRQEPGCRQYVGHQSLEEPRRFLFYEVYDDDAALQKHRGAPYFRQYVTEGLDRLIETRTRRLYRPSSSS
jgi:quinol monooxygenase YgiN